VTSPPGTECTEAPAHHSGEERTARLDVRAPVGRATECNGTSRTPLVRIRTRGKVVGFGALPSGHQRPIQIQPLPDQLDACVSDIARTGTEVPGRLTAAAPGERLDQGGVPIRSSSAENFDRERRVAGHLLRGRRAAPLEHTVDSPTPPVFANYRAVGTERRPHENPLDP
jgi:hypothetical protein